MPPLSGFYAGFPEDIVLDHGTLLIGNNVLSPSRGGVRFSPGVEYRVVPYDGQRTEVARTRRIVGWNARLTGTWLFVPENMLYAIEPGITSAAGVGNVTTISTPRQASELFAIGDYLTNVRMISSRTTPSAPDEYFQIHFDLAIIQGDWSIVTNDRDEWLLEGAEFKAVLSEAEALANPAQCPYTYEVLSAVS